MGKPTPNSLGGLHLSPFSTVYELLGPRVRHCSEGSRTSISDTSLMLLGQSVLGVGVEGVPNVKIVLPSLGFISIHRTKCKDKLKRELNSLLQKDHKLVIFKSS